MTREPDGNNDPNNDPNLFHQKENSAWTRPSLALAFQNGIIAVALGFMLNNTLSIWGAIAALVRRLASAACGP